MVVAAALGVVAWLANAADRLGGPAGDQGALGAVLAVDAVLGLGALALLTLHRRSPVLVTGAVTALIAGSAASFGAGVVALFWLATHRRRAPVAMVAVVYLASQAVAELSPLASPASATSDPLLDRVGSVMVGLLVLAVPVAVGYYLSARRELVATLRERAVAAEREQALVGEAAREAERTRIAREMHDVLAHRISLVALHAGALVYRDDLTRAETAGTAATIQSNAQLALHELRQVLGVLRAGASTETDVEDPQPTLA
ncbi:MAG: putative two-component system sensor kinase, partial [Actinotalea sp.]|nr:putative two-component system sensor kinase [Actinotalea sp.]